MSDKVKYYIVDRDALPEVFLSVVEAKKLIETGKASSVQEAVEKVGISRSSFYKYKDSISPFFESSTGKAITLSMSLEDKPGILSKVLNQISTTKSNLLTINQTIPINGIANITMSIQILEPINEYIEIIGGVQGVHDIRILARE